MENNQTNNTNEQNSCFPFPDKPIWIPPAPSCNNTPEAMLTYNIVSQIIEKCGYQYAELVANAVVPAAVQTALQKQISETLELIQKIKKEGEANIETMQTILGNITSIQAIIEGTKQAIEDIQIQINKTQEQINAKAQEVTEIQQDITEKNNNATALLEQSKAENTQAEVFYNNTKTMYQNTIPLHNETYQYHKEVRYWHEQIFKYLEKNLKTGQEIIDKLNELMPQAEPLTERLQELINNGLDLENIVNTAVDTVTKQQTSSVAEVKKTETTAITEINNNVNEAVANIDTAKTDALQAIDAEKTDIETIIGEGRTALEAKGQEALQNINSKEQDTLKIIEDKGQEITGAGAEAVRNVTNKEITAKEAIELLAESERQSLLNLLTASTLKAQNPGGLLPPVTQPFVLGYGSFEIENEAYKLLPLKDGTVEGTVEFTNDGGALTLQTQALTEPETWEAGQIIKLSVPINLVINSADIENIEVTAALAVKNGSETRFSLAKNFTLAPGNEVRIFPFEIQNEVNLEAGDIIAFGLSFPEMAVINRNNIYLARIPLGSKIRPTELIEMKTLPVTETGTQNILNALAADLAKTDVEVGSNGNGSYVKFNNGLLICLGKAVESTNSGSGILYTRHVFPHAFRDVQYLCCPANFKRIAAPENQYFFWSGLENATPSGISFGYIGNGTGIRYMAGIIAAGFWK